MATDQSSQPNHFELHGHGISITYDTTSLSGQSQLHYKSGQEDLTLNGGDIRTVQSEIGTLVTVSTTRTVDTGYTSLTVLIPQVNLVNNASPIKTEAILTTHHYFAANPSLVKGQLESYHTISLSGKASFVVY